jgi:hypothetical protein
MSNPEIAALQAEIRRQDAEIQHLKAELIDRPSIEELQHAFNDLILTFNSLNDLLRENAVLRGRELAEFNTKATEAVKNAQFPIEKLLVLNAYLRQQIGHVGRALKTRQPTTPTDQGIIRQAITKIGLRAMAIVEHVKIIAEGKKEVAFDSAQTRDFLAGREGKPPSRRDTIRALRRAEQICPALRCGHRPNDGRQTTRLTASVVELQDSPIFGYRDLWQRSGRNASLSV